MVITVCGLVIRIFQKVKWNLHVFHSPNSVNKKEAVISSNLPDLLMII